MNPQFARFLSVVFHPLLMPAWLFGLLLAFAPAALGLDVFSWSMRGSLWLLIFIFTFMVPAVMLYILYRSGYVPSLYLTQLADRRAPFFLTALTYGFVAWLFAFRMQLLSTLSPQLAILMTGIALTVLLVAVISLRWQISAHLAGLGGAIGIVIALMLQYSDQQPLLLLTAGLIAISGLVASARLQLNAHTLRQTLAGLALGFVVGLTTVLAYNFS